jgi:ABC-type multidrug transport system ATPase subunit
MNSPDRRHVRQRLMISRWPDEMRLAWRSHDPRHADFAERKVFMCDGQIVDEETLNKLRQEEGQRFEKQISQARARRDAVVDETPVQ